MEQDSGNLRESVVAQTIDRVLEDYPAQSYGKVLANPQLRKTLMVNVLSQLPSQFTFIEEGEISSIKPDGLMLPPEQEQSLKNLIRQEIVYIIQQKAECFNRTGHEEVESCLAPSHWFG